MLRAILVVGAIGSFLVGAVLLLLKGRTAAGAAILAFALLDGAIAMINPHAD